MKLSLWLFAILLLLPFSICEAQTDQTLIYASYFGGSGEEGGTLKALDVRSDL